MCSVNWPPNRNRFAAKLLCGYCLCWHCLCGHGALALRESCRHGALPRASDRQAGQPFKLSALSLSTARDILPLPSPILRAAGSRRRIQPSPPDSRYIARHDQRTSAPPRIVWARGSAPCIRRLGRSGLECWVAKLQSTAAAWTTPAFALIILFPIPDYLGALQISLAPSFTCEFAVTTFHPFAGQILAEISCP
jgi:hypothetical protein